MNKDDIKKALKCCYDRGFEIDCSDCPYHSENRCSDTLCKDTLDLIIEQENQIERLKKENDCLLKACEEPFTFNTTQNKKYSVFNTVRKEFAEELKQRSYCDNCFKDGKWHRYVFLEDVDELLKEYEQ